jgi:hypothetical protein
MTESNQYMRRTDRGYALTIDSLYAMLPLAGLDPDHS